MFLPIGSNLPFFRFPFATVTWVLLSVAVFAVINRSEMMDAARAKNQTLVGQKEKAAAEPSFQKSLTYQMSIVPQDEHHPAWKFLTYQFVHASWGHLISNMWYFLIFGWILENALGSFLFVTLTLLFGGLAVFPEFIFQKDLTVPIVGASGAVAFTMGAAASLFPRSRVKLLLMIIPLPNFPSSFYVPIRFLIYVWLAFQVSGLAMNQWVDPKPVAYATHLAGFGLGLLVGFSLRRKVRADEFVDVELSGADLKNFYQGLKALHAQQVEQGAMCLEKLSEKWPWMLHLQSQLFELAVQFRNRSLADSIWRRVLQQLLILRRASTLEHYLKAYVASFDGLPNLQIQERVLLRHLLKDRDAEDGELLLRLKA